MDERVARLQAQLSTKSSLFDVLSPPSPKESHGAVLEDEKLQALIRSVDWFAYVLVIGGMLLSLFVLTRESRMGSQTAWLPFLIMAGGVAHTVAIALRMVRTRVMSIESQLHALRGALHAAASPATNEPAAVS